MSDADFMTRAIAISRHSLDIPGAAPFGAVVVRDGIVVGEGLNHAAARFDPTSHGEVEAVKDACAKLKTLDLSGCDLYTSCEPCAMCVATMRIAGIRTLYYAASLVEAGPAIAARMTPNDRHRRPALRMRPAGARAQDARRADHAGRGGGGAAALGGRGGDAVARAMGHGQGARGLAGGWIRRLQTAKPPSITVAREVASSGRLIAG